MSATQPPDPWQAHSYTPEHEVYEPDPDDDDRGHSRSPHRRRTTGTPRVTVTALPPGSRLPPFPGLPTATVHGRAPSTHLLW
jgi:hypothetical protein